MAAVISFAEIVLGVIIVSAPWDTSFHRITILALVRVLDNDIYYKRFIIPFPKLSLTFEFIKASLPGLL